MKVVILLKVVPDDQDLQTGPGATLDISRAKPVVSSFDLNALEAATQMVESRSDDSLIALTVGASEIEESKLRKNILARGPEELFYVIDDSLRDADSNITATVLTAALKKIGEFDLILCGDGSADIYAQQVGVQLGEILQRPVTNAVSRFEIEGQSVVACRVLERVKETIKLPLPAVLCVSSVIAEPRICGLKEILAAGKKPVTTWSLVDLGVSVTPSIEVAQTYVPTPSDRKNQIFDAAVDGDLVRFIDAIKTELR
jgi:electron transfer flavoprotein beta subunit